MYGRISERGMFSDRPDTIFDSGTDLWVVGFRTNPSGGQGPRSGLSPSEQQTWA